MKPYTFPNPNNRIFISPGRNALTYPLESVLMVEKYIFYAGYQKPKTIVPREQKLSVLVQGDFLV